jgi:hypothetical protein
MTYDHREGGRILAPLRGAGAFFVRVPVVRLADSLYHRLRLLQASGLLETEFDFR